MAPYRDAALDRWHRRTVLMNGLGPGAGSRLKALNQSVSAQVGPLQGVAEQVQGSLC